MCKLLTVSGTVCKDKYILIPSYNYSMDPVHDTFPYYVHNLCVTCILGSCDMYSLIFWLKYNGVANSVPCSTFRPLQVSSLIRCLKWIPSIILWFPSTLDSTPSHNGTICKIPVPPKHQHQISSTYLLIFMLPEHYVRTPGNVVLTLLHTESVSGGTNKKRWP